MKQAGRGRGEPVTPAAEWSSQRPGPEKDQQSIFADEHTWYLSHVSGEAVK